MIYVVFMAQWPSECKVDPTGVVLRVFSPACVSTKSRLRVPSNDGTTRKTSIHKPLGSISTKGPVFSVRGPPIACT